MIQYKINIIDALKNAGFSSYKIRQNELVSWENINTICSLLNCQPGDILEHIPDEPSNIETTK